MEYRYLDKIGIRLSRLGFGCMRLPKTENSKGQELIDFDASTRMIHHAINNGINYFDTAHTYNHGDSERAVGDALLGQYRNKVYIGTKIWVADLKSADEFKRRFDLSMSYLRTNHIDLFFLHALTLKVWNDAILKYGIDKIIKEYQAKGLIKAVCFSSHDSPANVEAMIDANFFEIALLQYNILDQSYAETFIKAKKNGLGTLCMGPVAGGNLAERNSPWLEGIGIDAPCNADIALRYVFANRDIDCVLSGMSTIEELQANLKTVDNGKDFDEALLVRINGITDRLKKNAGYMCTWCKYCMPCPYGVHIPLNLKIHTVATLYQAPESAAKMYYRVGKEWFWPGNTAKSCVECKECLSKCPQHINIPEKLKELRGIVKDKG